MKQNQTSGKNRDKKALECLLKQADINMSVDNKVMTLAQTIVTIQLALPQNNRQSHE